MAVYTSSFTGAQVDERLGKVVTMGASGSGHKGGLVPDTPSTAGTSKYLREDGTWAEPSGGGSISGETIHPLTSVTGTAAVTESPFNAAIWTGTAANVTSLYANLTVSIKVPVTGNATYGTVLNINNLGNHPVLLNATTLISNQYAADCIIMLTYDADATASVYLDSATATEITGCWKISDYNTNTTYSNAKLGQGYATCATAEATAAKVATLSSYSLVTGGIVTVKFTYGVPANATLSINSQTAKAIYHKGAKIKAGIIKAGDFATFIYSSYYHLISIDRNFDDTFGASGSNHAAGLVPDPGATAGTTKFLREDGTWVVPNDAMSENEAKTGTATTARTVAADVLRKTANGYITSVTGATPSSQTLQPGVFYTFGTVTSLTVTFATPISGMTNEYKFEFDSGGTATQLSVPNTVVWPETLTISANKHYEINVKYDASNSKYYGLFMEWPNS